MRKYVNYLLIFIIAFGFVLTITVNGVTEEHKEAPKKDATKLESGEQTEAPVDEKVDKKSAQVKSKTVNKTEKNKSDFDELKRRVFSKSNKSLDESILDDLKRMRQELQEKEAELKAKEDELVSRERAISEEMAKIQVIRDQVVKAKKADDGKSQEKIAKLIETIDAMSPGPAAKLLSGIDDGLAVTVMMQLPSIKLSKILAKMEPDTAMKLSEKLSGLSKERTARSISSIGANSESSESQPEKGGDIDDRQNRKKSESKSDGKPSTEKSRGKGARNFESEPSSGEVAQLSEFPG
jgi:flagellar motility protein MotE (MotC chaperone)